MFMGHKLNLFKIKEIWIWVIMFIIIWKLVSIGVELNNVWYAGGHVFIVMLIMMIGRMIKKNVNQNHMFWCLVVVVTYLIFKRFENKMDAIEYFNKLEILSLNIVKNCYRRN